MPEEGIRYLPRKELLTYEEIERLVFLLAGEGVTKVRLTGGEPFVRNDLMRLIARIMEVPGMKEVHLTTNGVLTGPYVKDLKRLGIASVNLSLDTLDRKRFTAITRRDEFDVVMETFHQLLDQEIPVKINAVVMEDRNVEDIVPMVALTEQYPVSVRFIEEMPFNGEGKHYAHLHWTHKKIIEHIKQSFPGLEKAEDPAHSTSYNYKVPGHLGSVGVIAAFSRTFCGTCNRIRITAQGILKTCLYDDGVLNIKDLLRSGASDERIVDELKYHFGNRPRDGFEAEHRRKNGAPIMESMSTIGG
jgi:cyclic pyranopterin phosphate synthase